MSELAEDFKFLREIGRAKRRNNAASSLEFLKGAQIPYRILNESNHHTLIELPDCHPIDFWPSTGKWRQRKSGFQNRGVKSLIGYCKGLQTAIRQETEGES